MTQPTMSFKKNGQTIIPLKTYPVNGKYILGVYQGSLSKFDMLLKYRQKNEKKWSRIRTPKHIHWVVDILLKMQTNKKVSDKFLNFLLEKWKKTKGFKNSKERISFLSNSKNLMIEISEEAKEFNKMASQGEYSLKFLILVAELLMLQEKSNNSDAYMFKNLLESLKDGSDLFKIISIATHR